MKFSPTDIPGLVIVEPRIFKDGRGWFFESYRQDIFSQYGISERFVQDNESRSAKGVLRGLHYQSEPHAQAKLVHVLRGRIFDVAVDLRAGSATFGKHFSMILDDVERKMLYLPPGFAHGFCALEDDTEFHYKVSDFYHPEFERGILWNDPDLGIEWPKTDYIFSEKDRKYPRLREVFKKIL